MPLFQKLLANLKGPQSLGMGAPPAVHSMRLLCNPKPWATAFTLTEEFLPQMAAAATQVGPQAGLHMQSHTAFGTLFGPTLLGDQQIITEHFSNLQVTTGDHG